MFGNRLRKNARHRRKWARRTGVSCYRLYDRDIPELPFAVDWYEGRLHIAEFVRPHDRSPAEHAVWVDAMAEAAAQTLEVAPDQVYLKRRDRQRGDAQYDRFADRGQRLVVNEGGHQFLVNLSDYLDTGLFLDHRQTRAMIGEAAAGKRVANLFAYTGSFTVYAAAAGARETVTVDLSTTYLDWTRDNMALNGLRGPAHTLVRADARRWLDEGAEHGPCFDIIVVDPPTFSNSKRMDGVLDVRRDHPWLIGDALAMLRPGGFVLFSTNARKFRLDRRGLEHARFTELTDRTTPPDFPRRPHRVWRVEAA